MNNFNYKKYLSEGKLLKDSINKPDLDKIVEGNAGDSSIGDTPIPSKYFKKYMDEYSSEITQAKRYFSKEDWPVADKVRKYLKSATTPTTVDEYIKWHAGAKALTGGQSFGMGSGFAKASSLIVNIIVDAGTTNKIANLWDSKVLPYIDQNQPSNDTINEGVWNIPTEDEIIEFVAHVEEMKDKFYHIGSDGVFDGLDQAITSAKELSNPDQDDEDAMNSIMMDAPDKY